MKIVRVEENGGGGIRHGALQENGEIFAIKGDIFGKWELTGERLSGRLLAPLVPPAIYAIGANYLKHIEESGAKRPVRPMLFMKAPTAVQDPGEPIWLPRHMRSDKVDYEGELAVVIGKRCKNVRREDALDYVLGYTCANDVSARDWQKEWGEGQFCRGKTFDSFCPLGPTIVTRDEIPDPQRLEIRTWVNGEVRQQSSTGDMLFDVRDLIAFVSGSTTLLPGTVILTGTPEGVGMGYKPPLWLQAGDVVTVAISGIGELSNPVAEEPGGC